MTCATKNCVNLCRKENVRGVLQEVITGIAKAVLDGDTGSMAFPGGFDIDVNVKDNSSATSFDVYGDITLKFLKDGKEVDVTITRTQTNTK
jgi:hypothetical protein